MDLIDGSGFWEGGEITPAPPEVVFGGGTYWADEDAWNRELARRWREAENKRIVDDDEEFIITHIMEVEEEVYA